MKVEMLRLFLAVAQCGNIQQAADENFISRQSLSVMLKNLERELGKTLLVRNNQGVLLTEEGRRFARCAKKVTEAFDEFWTEEGKGERRVLNLYTLPALNEIFAELQGCQIHHKYYLSVQIRETEELIAMFEKKKSGVVYPSVAYEIGARIQEVTGSEVRVTVPGHMQRGGEPCPYDRVLATRLGAAAAELIINEEYGYMAAVKNNEITKVPLSEVAGKLKTVDPDCSMIREAKRIGISFGDE